MVKRGQGDCADQTESIAVPIAHSGQTKLGLKFHTIHLAKLQGIQVLKFSRKINN